jgi:hypothetical protein
MNDSKEPLTETRPNFFPIAFINTVKELTIVGAVVP